MLKMAYLKEQYTCNKFCYTLRSYRHFCNTGSNTVEQTMGRHEPPNNEDENVLDSRRNAIHKVANTLGI
jgi:hypothetical protein